MALGSSLINSFSTLISVCRVTSPDHYDDSNGFFVKGQTSNISIRGSLQPMNFKELMTLPEGNRDKEWLKFYTTTELFTDQTSPFRSSDVITVNCRKYKVMQIQNFTFPGPSVNLNYYRINALSMNDYEDPKNIT